MTLSLRANSVHSHTKFYTMKFFKFIALSAFAIGSLGLSSCGCATGEEAAPSLQSLPKFKELPVLKELPVTDEK